MNIEHIHEYFIVSNYHNDLVFVFYDVIKNFISLVLVIS